MKLTVGVFAHVDAGKTTFAEQVLFNAQKIRQAGRVDHQNSYMDYHPIERARGITVFADQAVFDYNSTRWYLMDTPGHVDFSPEAERTMRILDAAILLIDGVEGVQSHTETLWRLLTEYQIPTFVFVNKMDRENADISRVIKQLKTKCADECVLFSGRFNDMTMDVSLAEELAETDEDLLEYYLEQGYEPAVFLEGARRVIAKGQLFPVFGGSALKNEGIVECMQAVSQLMRPERASAEAPFEGMVYKVRHNSAGNRLTFLKVLSGTLNVRDMIVTGEHTDGTLIYEKISALYSISGEKQEVIDKALPGDLCVAVGLSDLRPGDCTGSHKLVRSADYQLVPLLSAEVLYDTQVNPRTVYEAFKILEEEEPMLAVDWNESLKALQIHVMGQIQLEVFKEILAERFGIAVDFGKCKIVYKETIAAPVMGYGHFEPLRHYAEVHLRLEPGERGSGIAFASECPVDILDKNYQNLVRTHVFEREHHGVLTGSGLADVRVVLTAGRAHLKHTEGGDFRQATYRAIRQGLEKAESILLEPIYAFEIEVPTEYMGRVLSDIPMMSGSFEAPQQMDETVYIKGCCPVATMMDYSQTLTAFSRGQGRLRLAFGGYAPCHNSEEVIEAASYDRKCDLAHSSDSVFCSHGAGVNIPWNEVEAHLHVQL